MWPLFYIWLAVFQDIIIFIWHQPQLMLTASRSVVGCQVCFDQWMETSRQCPKCRSEDFVFIDYIFHCTNWRTPLHADTQLCKFIYRFKTQSWTWRTMFCRVQFQHTCLDILILKTLLSLGVFIRGSWTLQDTGPPGAGLRALTLALYIQCMWFINT